MVDVMKHEPGAFCWPELTTSDAPAARRFYGELFEWEVVETPLGPDTPATHAVFQMRGRPVAGLVGMPSTLVDAGVPSHWLSHVAVDDLAGVVARVEPVGGRIVRAPGPVLDLGHLAVIEDPSGAALALWTGLRLAGVGIVNEPGALCWTELATPDPAAATAFYAHVLGWGSRVSGAGGNAYTEFLANGRSVAGLLPMSAEWGATPAHWMVYFAVVDCDECVERATQLGGRVVVPATDVIGTGRFAALADPQDAVFSVIALAEAA
jgi:uncharacterized protein